MAEKAEALTIVYDGQCPACTYFSSLARLRCRFELSLVDAREECIHSTIYELCGIDLNEEMLVIYRGRTFRGPHALTFILINGGNVIFRFLGRFLAVAGPNSQAHLYGLLVEGRRFFLRCLGRSDTIG